MVWSSRCLRLLRTIIAIGLQVKVGRAFSSIYRRVLGCESPKKILNASVLPQGWLTFSPDGTRLGDGRMDHSEVWADDLPPCYGVVAARGGVIVACTPDIVYLADRDHDGKVDFRETLFTGFDHSVMERGINNPKWGLDNWIYVGAGRHAGTIRGPYLAEPVQFRLSSLFVRPSHAFHLAAVIFGRAMKGLLR